MKYTVKIWNKSIQFLCVISLYAKLLDLPFIPITYLKCEYHINSLKSNMIKKGNIINDLLS